MLQHSFPVPFLVPGSWEPLGRAGWRGARGQEERRGRPEDRFMEDRSRAVSSSWQGRGEDMQDVNDWGGFEDNEDMEKKMGLEDGYGWIWRIEII